MAVPAGGYLRSAPGFEPPYTTADEDKLAEEADNLDELAGRITGHGEQLRSVLESGAASFSELVADGLNQRSGSSVETVRQATSAAIYGSTVIRALASDVTEFKHTVHSLVEQWISAGDDNFGLAASASQAELADARAGVYAELMGAARKAKDKLDNDAAGRGTMLKTGPTPATLAVLGQAGFIGWAAFNLFGDNNVATEKVLSLLKSGEPLSDTQLRNLTTVLAALARDPQAANRLLVQLRPAGLLRGYGNIVLSGGGSARLQESLGGILALGTRPGMYSVSLRWREELLAQVDSGIGLEVAGPGPDGSLITLPGGRLLAPLVEHGRHDSALLFSAARLVHRHSADWPEVSLSAPLSPAHPEYSPLSSVLHGLSSHPKAAERFIRVDEVGKTGDGTGSAPTLAELADRPDVAPAALDRLREALSPPPAETATPLTPARAV